MSERNASLTKDSMTAANFLTRCAEIGGRIVCTGDLSVFQIAEARVEDRMYVDDRGYGYVILPWDLRCIRDAGGRASAEATASESDDSRIAKTLTEPAMESSGSSTSGPEATSSQGNRPMDPHHELA